MMGLIGWSGGGSTLLGAALGICWIIAIQEAIPGR